GPPRARPAPCAGRVAPPSRRSRRRGRRCRGEWWSSSGEVARQPAGARHYPAMALPGSDDPPEISAEEGRQELFGRGPSKVGMELYEVIAIIVAIVGGAIAIEEIDSWAQWVVLAAIIVTLIGFMIAVSPNRPE